MNLTPPNAWFEGVLPRPRFYLTANAVTFPKILMVLTHFSNFCSLSQN